MAQILYIDAQDITKRSPIGGNVDFDKYVQSIALVQDTELKPILGTDLMDRIDTEITGVISTAIQMLLDDYIKDFLVNAAVSSFALTSNYQMNNGGINTYNPDNGQIASLDNVIRLTDSLDSKRNFYGQKMIDFLKENQTDYPEWKGSSTKSMFIGWELGDNNGCDGW